LVDSVNDASSLGPWDLRQPESLMPEEGRNAQQGLPTAAAEFRALRAQGFSGARLAKLTHTTEAEVREQRRALGVRPVFKRIDSCAGEFRAETPYMYSTYETGALGQLPDNEAEPSDRRKAIILGGGPNRIGQDRKST